jgi:hypothetical protein
MFWIFSFLMTNEIPPVCDIIAKAIEGAARFRKVARVATHRKRPARETGT